MARFILDCETDGLVDKLTVLHCLVLEDLDTGELHSFADQPGYRPISEGVALAQTAQMLVGHNIIGFDILAIQKIYPDFKPTGFVVDTLILSRLVFPDVRKQIDFTLQKKGKLPGHLMGRHSLESWGYRIGNYKGEYKDWCKENGIEDPWSTWRPETQAYCVQDVSVTRTLFLRLLKRMAKQGWRGDSVSLEHDVQRIIFRQIERGFMFDQKAAVELHVKLVKRRLELEELLQAAFPPQTIVTPFYPKANNKPRGYVKGVLFNKTSVLVFNPSSRQHIADRLKAKYAWEPEEFTDGGEPKIDEETLQGFEWPEAALLNEYLMIDKRLSLLVEGKGSLMKAVKADGAVHGNVNILGAATSRMSHSGPNMTGVPKVGSHYGEEMRSLFVARPGWVLVGCDADAIQIRGLGHFLCSRDGGAYVEAILRGRAEDGTDMHSLNAKAIGLDAIKKYLVASTMITGRAIAKTFFYAWLFGAGGEKLGRTCGEPRGVGARAVGNRKKLRLETGIVGLTNPDDPKKPGLLDSLKNKVLATGTIFGLDGRVLPIRSPRTALSTLLQNAEATVMKRALVILEDLLASASLHPGRDYEYVLNAHDELQIEVRPQHAEQVGQLAAEAIKKAGEYYRFKCPLAGNYKVGRTWADTH